MVKLLMTSIVMLLVGAVLVGNNKAYADNVPYSIIYDDNVTSNMPTDVDTTSMSEQVTMANNTPTRPGFKYLGWCSVIPTNSGGTDLCTGGTSYQPSTTLTLDQTGANNFHFYAMWKEDNSMQSFTAAKCSAMSIGDTITLIDSRDDQAYTIGKLVDDKCWMLDNLALDLTNNTILNGMNESNTHASNTTLGYLKGTTTRDPSIDTSGKYATSGVSVFDSTNTYSDPRVNLESKDLVPSDDISQAGQYKIGGYYNYCAASAGSYCYGNGTSYGTSSGGNATEDICPKGWRMPTGGTSGEYSALATIIYGSPSTISGEIPFTNYRSALHLPLSGNYQTGSANNQGSTGGFWASTFYSYDMMYRLTISQMSKPSSVYPAYQRARYYGNSVRCVLGT